MRRSPLILFGTLFLSIGVFGQSTTSQPILPAHELPNLNDLQTVVKIDQTWFKDDQARLAADQARLADYEKQLIAYHDCADL